MAAAPITTSAPPPEPPAEPAEAADPGLAGWERLIWLPCNLGVELSVPRVTVGDILRLQVDSVVETRWQQNADVPIRANGQLIAWAEFEGVDEKLAVRVTRIA